MKNRAIKDVFNTSHTFFFLTLGHLKCYNCFVFNSIKESKNKNFTTREGSGFPFCGIKKYKKNIRTGGG